MQSADSLSRHPAKHAKPTKRRPWVILLGIIIGLFALIGIVYAVDYFLTKDKVPRGVTVASVAIGGMEPAAAEAKLGAELNDSLATPVKVKAGTKEATVDPTVAGLRPDWPKTIEAAGKQPLNPIDRFRGLFGTREVGIVSDVDDAALTPQIERLNAELNVDPTEGAVVLAEGKPQVTQPAAGQKVTPEELRKRIAADWLSPHGVEIKVEETSPVIGEKAVRDVVEGDAKRALAGPIIVHGVDNIDGIIPVEQMGEVVTFVPEDKHLRTEVNIERAQEILAARLADTEVPLKNANISFSGGSRTVTPHSDGRSIEWNKITDGLRERIVGSEPKEFDATYKEEAATFTTEEAEKATFDETVSEFTTSGFSSASGVNIRRVAEMVDGAIVVPGQVFSLNGYTGPRGKPQGFVESGIILNGRGDTAVGGGISQFATTLYNAAYFAGFDDVAHTPHSYYISRYPAGREATVYEGLIDLKFRNNSKYPVMIKTSADSNSVTVRMLGVKTVSVESVSAGRWAPTQPSPITVHEDDCVPSGGISGFTTADTRIIRDLNGKELDRQRQVTKYDPKPIVRCG